MTTTYLDLVQAYVRRKGTVLAPGWSSAAPGDLAFSDESSLGRLCEALGWACTGQSGRPKAQDFPLLAWHAGHGWCFAEQWVDDDTVRMIGSGGPVEAAAGPELSFWSVEVPGAQAAKPATTALRVVWSAIMRRRSMLFDATVATVVVNLIALVTSIYSMQVYDRVIPRGGFATLTVLTLGMVFALVIDLLIRNTRAMMIDREAGTIDAEISEYFFARMQAVRMDSRPGSIGTMAAQLRGTDQVRGLLSSASLFVLADLPFALVFIFVMASLGGIVALVPIVAFPLSLLLAYLMAVFIRGDAAASQVSGNRKNGLLVESLDAAETIKANQGGWHMLATWNRLVEEVHHHDLKVKRWSTFSGTGFSLIQQLAYVGVVCVGALQVAEGHMTMGAVVACSILSGRVSGPLVASLPNLIVQWGYARSSLASLDAILAMPSDRPLDRVPVRMPSADGRIEASGIRFLHQGARNGLAVPQLSVAPGSRIAVIGPVGSGKSTFLRLLAGLYAPQDGHVLLDGIDMRQAEEADLRRHICYFPQDYRLINGTLRENLTLGLSEPGDERLLEVLGQTGLADLVNGHPLGLDLPISEGGMGLSGGQRTLVGLSRALLADARVYLLDEPTANLDQETEMRLLRALIERLSPSASLIMVSHKMQLLSLVDRIVVLAQGQVALDGPRDAVIAKLLGDAQ